MTTRKRRYLVFPGTAAPPPSGQRFNGGHWVALARDQIFTGTGINEHYTGIPNATVVSNTGPIAAGVTGLLVPHDWNELEPTLGTYDFSRITSELMACANSPANSGAGVQYILKLVTKSFRDLGTNPLPLDLQAVIGSKGDPNYSPDGRATFFPKSGPGGKAGYSVWRWDPPVAARLKALYNALGAAFGTNVNFNGIAMQETAPGYTPVTAVDGYGTDNSKFMAAWVNEAKNIAGASPYIRPYPFFNFLPAGSNDQATIDLANAAAQLQQYGAILGEPDLVTDLSTSGIVHRCYDILSAYQSGGSVSRQLDPKPAPPTVVTMPGAMGTFQSVQTAEWTGGDPGDPNPSPMDLYNYMTQSYTFTPSTTPGDPLARDHRIGKPLMSPICCPMWFVDWHNNGSPQFNHAATDIIQNVPVPFPGAWHP